MQDAAWTIRWDSAIADIDREQWDRLALAAPTPLLEWRWLAAMETSGSIAPAHGWYPRHLTLWEKGRLIAAAPFYLKTHSAGEFVFDHAWVRFAEQLNVTYYPKLVGMSPATPAVGYRFLVDEGVDPIAAAGAMLDAVDALCRSMGLSGSHLHFVDPDWRARVGDNRYLAWRHQSFLWKNPGFRSFDDYLSRFTSRWRRNIRKERRRMDSQRIEIRALTGDAIDPSWSEVMYRYYLNTNAHYGPWAARYLNRFFFDEIFRTCRHRLLLFAAMEPFVDDPLALSLLVHKDRHLIGRYWGCRRPVKDLHFNMCFYAPIEWAIANGITTFDPGAGSSHKIYRGFEAVTNTSLHRFYAPQLAALFQRFIGGVNQMEASAVDALNEHLPYANRS